ncbi:alkaline phosphatase [Neolewinella lacunae]|uniref:Alkaline phosphatase n=1 Tax=Neolewinella lacunae TaxID=1517758 RepID=A0A923PGI2_9BACT|nr:alkaline phosphatase [Neolewinella lacunae]MBC6992849.1 alkaline phosphatase [Neolewinella lacunae]MDN3633787.1 alkaline phosphatase [Neolewinella lacunae]
MLRLSKISSALFLALLALSACTPQAKEDGPINVIFLIGDGMGLPQVSSAFYFGDDAPNFLQFEKIGLMKTNSSSHKVTDSAAAATAMATGVRSYNRAISVSPDSLSVPSILELLRDQAGYQTGLVSLTTITHATPACFYAHVEDRDQHEDIAAQLATARVDFFAGGGLKYFTQRKDQRNLYQELLGSNYHLDSLQLSAYDPAKKNGYFLASESLPSKVEGRGNFLPDATQLGLDYLSESGKPFFLMVEGSYIDWAGHAENDTMLIQEMADFNETLGVVLAYLEKHPNTLLVVTADHETGGVSLDKQYEAYKVFGQQKVIPSEVAIRFNSNQHSAELVPVFAKGPGEDYFQGIYQNNEIYFRMLQALNIQSFSNIRP